MNMEEERERDSGTYTERVSVGEGERERVNDCYRAFRPKGEYIQSQCKDTNRCKICTRQAGSVVGFKGVTLTTWLTWISRHSTHANDANSSLVGV